MSSRFSPSIEVDCRPSRHARWAVPLALSGAVVAPLFARPRADVLLLCLMFAGVLAAMTGLSRHRHPGLRSAVLTSDGKWWLVDAQGQTRPGRLLPDSRVLAHGLWLRWDSPAGRRHAWLWRRSTQAEAVRRLAGRLKVDGLPAPESPHSAGP